MVKVTQRRAFLQKFIFARALFSCETPDILTTNQSRYVQNITPDTPEEVYELLFCHVADRDFGNEWHGDRKIVGIIVLEGLMQDAMCSLQALPCGFLIFYSLEARDEILWNAQFTNQHLKEGAVRIVWVSWSAISMLQNELQENAHLKQLTWSFLWEKLVVSILRQNRNHSVCPLHHERYNFNTVSLHNTLTRWCEQIGSWEIDGDGRTLTPLEHLWLYFHVRLRMRREFMDMNTARRLFSDIRLENVTPTDQQVDCTAKLSRMHHGMIARMTGQNPGLAEKILDNLLHLHDCWSRVVLMTCEGLIDAMHDRRQTYKAFPLYTSCVLKTFTEESIATIPLSLTNIEPMRQWISGRRHVLLCEEMSTEKVYSSVYANIRPIYAGSGKEFLRLYGNMNGLIEAFRTIDPEAPAPMSFMLDHIGTLSNNRCRDLPLYGGSTRQGTPFQLSETPIVARLTEASDHCTPIWTVPLPGNSVKYIRIIPVLGKKRKYDTETAALYDLISQYMYPLEEKLSFTNELLQSGLHWSSFVADIDMKFPTENEKPLAIEVAKEVVLAFTSVFNVLFPEKNIRRHMVFASKDDSPGDRNKLGLHYHAQLPAGLVFTSSACRDIAKILEILRHSYPHLCKVPHHEAVFDSAIYPIPNYERPFNSHCLRGPFQAKMDGSRKLEPVYDTQPTKKIKANDILIHGFQFDNHGQRVLYGTVVDGIIGVRDLSDVAFFRSYEAKVMNDNISEVCRDSVAIMVKEVNKRIVLFEDIDDPTSRLLSVINELWVKTGRQLFADVMSRALGRADKKFDNLLIKNVVKKSKFILDKSQDTINLTMDGRTPSINFCPRRPHTKPQRNVKVTVGYSSKMIKFVLFVSGCFSTSCRHRRFLPGVPLNMPNIFVTKCIQAEIESFFYSTFCHAGVRVIRLYESNERGQVWKEEVIHQGMGAKCLFLGVRLDVEFRRLFAFLRKTKFLAFSIHTRNLYIACKAPLEGTQSPIVYASSSPNSLLTCLKEKKVIQESLFTNLVHAMNDEKSS